MRTKRDHAQQWRMHHHRQPVDSNTYEIENQIVQESSRQHGQLHVNSCATTLDAHDATPPPQHTMDARKHMCYTHCHSNLAQQTNSGMPQQCTCLGAQPQPCAATAACYLSVARAPQVSEGGVIIQRYTPVAVAATQAVHAWFNKKKRT